MGGGNRNSQSKAERRIDRKQRREAEAKTKSSWQNKGQREGDKRRK